MKLKTRLIIAFFIITLVPLTMTGLALLGVGNYQMRAIEEKYGIEDVNYKSIANTLSIISEAVSKDWSEIQDTMKESPEELLDVRNLENINQQLMEKCSSLLVRVDDDIYYQGKQRPENILEILPEYGEGEGARFNGIYVGGKVQALIRQADMLMADGSKVSVFLLISLSDALPQFKTFLRDMMIIIILILVVTATCLTYWIYNGISTPLKKLRLATQEIKEGNLDFELRESGNSEFSELCQDFEDMRIRLKESAEAKLEYDKQNKELISNISHDLKTPITAVKGYVEGIMDGVADTPEKMDRYIRTIYNKANDMDRLINELTFYSKIDTNRIPYTFSKINVRDYFDDCVEEVGLDLESKNIQFTYFNDVSPSTIVIADAEQIKRVINNIIGNSEKYMDKPQEIISMHIKDAGDFIQVEIEDNGKGIAQKDLSVIFDRFYRTDASRNSSKGGSGIGLSIVKKIIEDHGGKIWASSKLGQGTIMYFVLRKYQEVPVNE